MNKKLMLRELILILITLNNEVIKVKSTDIQNSTATISTPKQTYENSGSTLRNG